MSKIWAVARHTVAEGVRMKIALVFLVLIGLIVLGLPFSIQGDSSLTGAVQTFMSYALSASGLLLGLLTIFMSRSLADELVQHQVYLIVTKPLPRWQYILGKWLGITALNVAFLTCVGFTIYGMVHYIRATHPPIDDQFDAAELNDEVLVARQAVRSTLPDFRQPAEQEFQRNLEQGLYDNVPDFDPRAEQDRLAKKYEARWRVVGPLETRVFQFKRVLCDRSPDTTLQIRYKTQVSDYPPDEIFRAVWRIGNPLKGTPVYVRPVRHVVGRYHTVRFPADAVADDHTLTVYFFNENPFENEPQYRNVIEFRKSDEVELLFVVGSFGGNLLRLLTLMLCKLMFLAAVAVLMVTVFSFSVACLASFTIYVLAGMRAFITESLQFSTNEYLNMFSSAKEFFVRILMHVYQMMHWIIPDFARYDAVEVFVNGRNVSLVWVLQGLFWLVLVKTVIVLGLAMLAFQRREVAEVSV